MERLIINSDDTMGDLSSPTDQRFSQLSQITRDSDSKSQHVSVSGMYMGGPDDCNYSDGYQSTLPS